MSEVDQRQFGFIDPRNHKLRRGVYLLPSALTVANLLCGFYAILEIFKAAGTASPAGVADLDYAARAIGVAMIFDAFDGFVARATHTSSDFGKQFDSLADMVSFCLAPAILAFAWGVHDVLLLDAPEARRVSQLGWLATCAFVICCAWRLARFNVQGMAPGGGLRYFVGMPTPAAAGVVAATVHAFRTPLDDWRWSVVWLLLVLSLAALMVSTIRFPSFKDIPLAKRQHSIFIVVAALLVWSIFLYSEVVLMLIACGYMLTGITLHVIRSVRHRLVSRPA